MASHETTTTRQPFQFGLRSIFLATAAIAVAFGLLKWLGPEDFFDLVILAVNSSAVVVVVLKSRGTAWIGVLIAGVTMALLVIVLSEHRAPLFHIFVWTSLAAWLGGGITASGATKRQSPFLRWACLLALAWFLIIFFVSMAFFFD